MTGEFPAQRANNEENVPFDDVIIGYTINRWFKMPCDLIVFI